MRDFLPVVFLIEALIACGEPAAVPLANIERTEPESLEPNDTFRIFGNGFVEGSVDVVLTGSIKTLGKESAESTPSGPLKGTLRKIHLKGIAVSERAIEIGLSGQILKQIIEEPSVFEGTIEVDFDVQGNVRLFAKKTDIRLELNPGGAGVKAYARKTREAETSLESFGIRLASSAEVTGLIVAAVTSESPAARVGIEFGDRLLSLDGRPLVDIQDFAQAEPSKNHTVELVTRAGIIRKVNVGPAVFGGLERDELTAIIFSSIAFGLFWAVAAPTGRRLTRSSNASRDPFARAVIVGFISLLLCLIPAVILFVYGGPLIWLLLLCGHAAGTIAFFLIGRQRPLFALLTLTFVPTVVATTSALCSAIGPLETVIAGLQSPLSIFALANPFMSASAVVSLFLIWPHWENGNRRNSLSAFFALLSAAFSAAVVTLCLLGGWNIPMIFESISLDSALTRGAASVIFMLKAWLVLAVSRRLSRFSEESRRKPQRGAPAIGPLLLIAFSAASVIWNAAKIPVSVQTAGQILAAGIFAAAISYFTATEVRGFLLKREIRIAEIRVP